MGLARKKPLNRGTSELKRTPLARGDSQLARGGAPKQRSAKTDKIYQQRRPLVARLLAERPLCEACVVFATHDGQTSCVQRPSVDLHELVRRSQGGSILDEDNILTVCRPCHERIGNHPQLAFDLGLAKHSWERHLLDGEETP